MKTLDVIDIAKNTSVKFISGKGDADYNPDGRKAFETIKGSPANVKACLYYNDLLDKWGLSKMTEKIKNSYRALRFRRLSGSQVKYTMLAKTPIS